MFLTPEINGWILVLGIDIPDLAAKETQELLKKVSQEFGECQLFLTNRIVECHFWGIVVDGEILRLYSYLAESGKSIIQGQPTKSEQKYHVVNTLLEEANSDDYWERDDIVQPDEEIVM